MSQTKINRARKLSKIGDNPSTFAAMLDAIPTAALGALTSAQIAEVIDANWRLAGASKAIATREACDSGYIWDDKRQTMREIS